MLGTVRRTGIYADGVESCEIWIELIYLGEINYIMNDRVDVTLIMPNNEEYIGGIRVTQRNNYIWICPDLHVNNTRIRLADILRINHIGINTELELEYLDEDRTRMAIDVN